MTGAITESIDVAQVVLYAFWLFFAALIVWLRREDRREGYPLESDKTRKRTAVSPIFIPPPKTFLLPHGGSVSAPSFERDSRALMAVPTSAASGAPLSPTGDAMRSGMGPAAFAMRADTVERTREGHDLIVPMRGAPGFSILAGPDPRGYPVYDGAGAQAAVVTDLWVDRADVMVRYLEVALGDGSAATPDLRLVPIGMLVVDRDRARVDVEAMLAPQFEGIPTTREATRITIREEEMISAYWAGARLYATPKRLGPKL